MDKFELNLENLSKEEQEKFLYLVERSRTKILTPLDLKISITIGMNVLQVDDRLRGEGVLFEASNGWTLFSVNEPEISLDDKCIYINGRRREKDGIATTNNLCYYDDAIEFNEKAKQAVAEFNRSERVKVEQYKELVIAYVSIVTIKVKKMDESLRGIKHLYTSDDNICFCSEKGPELCLDTVGLWGQDASLDSATATMNFIDPEEAVKFCRKIRRSVSEFNEYLETKPF